MDAPEGHCVQKSTIGTAPVNQPRCPQLLIRHTSMREGLAESSLRKHCSPEASAAGEKGRCLREKGKETSMITRRNLPDWLATFVVAAIFLLSALFSEHA